MNSNQLPSSLDRYLGGDPASTIHPCASAGCNRIVLSGQHCAKCAAELDALREWREQRDRRCAAGSPLHRFCMRLATWTPSDDQIRRLTAFIPRAGSVLGDTLKIAAVLAVLYLAAEIGSAFLPGGAVQRILGGR